MYSHLVQILRKAAVLKEGAGFFGGLFGRTISAPEHDNGEEEEEEEEEKEEEVTPYLLLTPCFRPNILGPCLPPSMMRRRRRRRRRWYIETRNSKSGRKRRRKRRTR